jgi:hypothetical protein
MEEILADDTSGELVLMALTNPEVLAIEKYMMALGVQVTFANSKDLGKLVVMIFNRMKKLGKCLPPRIFLFRNMNDSSETGKTFGLQLPFPAADALWSPIFFECNLIESLQLEPKEKSQNFVDNSPSGVIHHELGHFYHNLNGIDFIQFAKIFRTACLGKGNKPTKLFRKIRNSVSPYATSDCYGCEFVAEVFSGLAIGKSFANDIMDLYHKLNGPML